MALPRPAPGTGKWWAIGVLGCAAGTALAIWLGLASSLGQVTWNDIGYRVVDDRTVSVTFDVHRPEGQAVTCTVRAQDRSHGDVGSIEVDIPAGGPVAVSRTVEIRTTTRAVTGNVRACSAGPDGG